MTKRRLALLGFGHVAEHGHLPAWLARDDFTIAAVAEPSPARRAVAERLLPGIRLHDDAAALLAGGGIDVVDIAAPPALHVPLALRAAAAGCHIVCEKPLAVSLAEYRTLVAAVQSAGVVLFTVHNWKHSLQFSQLRELLAEGAVGRPTHLSIETVRAGRAVSVGSEWRGEAAMAGGGILVDHGWHALYLLLGLAGEAPQRIAATVERRRYLDGNVEDTARCRIEFASMTGEMFLTWAGDTRRTRWQAHGTAGTVTLADDRGELVGTGARREWAFPLSLSAGSHHPDWFGGVIDDFVAEIEDPRLRGRNLAEASRCVQLTALAYESSARRGETLPVPAVPAGEGASA
jgi:predicted dehydrogenase